MDSIQIKDIYEELLSDGDSEVRNELARGFGLPLEIQIALAFDHNEDIRISLATNHFFLAQEVIDVLRKDSSYVVRVMAMDYVP
jgi:hypothetical protein